MLKKYHKEYEDYYKKRKTFNINEVTIEGIDFIEKYQNELYNLNREFQLSVFDHLVKITWLARKFRYKGKRKELGFGKNGMDLDYAFKYYYRNVTGIDFKLIYGNAQYSAIITYFNTFFPDFDTSNPFKGKYEYPYKYMAFEHILFVKNLDERIELLKDGEEKRMSIIDFFNYIINFVQCCNEEEGYEKYRLSWIRNQVLCIINNKEKV